MLRKAVIVGLLALMTVQCSKNRKGTGPTMSPIIKQITDLRTKADIIVENIKRDTTVAAFMEHVKSSILQAVKGKTITTIFEDLKNLFGDGVKAIECINTEKSKIKNVTEVYEESVNSTAAEGQNEMEPLVARNLTLSVAFTAFIASVDVGLTKCGLQPSTLQCLIKLYDSLLAEMNISQSEFDDIIARTQEVIEDTYNNINNTVIKFISDKEEIYNDVKLCIKQDNLLQM